MEPDTDTRNLPDALAGFCVPSLLPCPCACQAAEKDLIPQETESLSVGAHIGHADASSLPSDGSGRAKNGASFFP